MREKAGESLFTLHNCVIQSESWRSERNEHSGHQLLRKNNKLLSNVRKERQWMKRQGEYLESTSKTK